ncbi:hypothetical protein GUJ93_ZPchr0014g47350 [Zizania palustris]|uniref:Uncharacterized protein n=1 Tax=Zizania palustris TaxID=103762 RepID=A0A8J5SWX9_ZIZPA|nr:hypothetical protein GUJ93_ZPchr0014g47350 [Zizania palustris]
MVVARKGTATPLGTVFSPEEGRGAGGRGSRRAELARIEGFAADNAALVSLVPFGGATFFPGHLIYTNELLGRGTMQRGPLRRPLRYCAGGG